ncbi:MAG: cytochrome c oxidase subunit 3 [Leptospiraceae bacterium]|nr:cytochrome c oxidase subunit 3 [Leptospiraceae bacterium]
MAIGAMGYEKLSNPDAFSIMRKAMSPIYGFLNTILLITSGYFLVLANRFHHLKKDNFVRGALLGGILLGVGFLILKSMEYSSKFSKGIELHSNDFFTFYFFLTGFHFLHVMVGIFILTFLLVRQKTVSEINFEAGAIFWHMCDLIWIMIFPLFYLV